jgi:hypothetical protein
VVTIGDGKPGVPSVTRRQALRIGAVVGGTAFAAPVLSILTADPASAKTERSSQSGDPGGHCHPAHPDLYIVCNWHGQTIGLLCPAGSNSFAPFGSTNVQSNLRTTFGQHGCWSSRWGTYDGGQGGSNGHSTYQGSVGYSQPQNFFSPATYNDCQALGSNCFHFDPGCSQPISWKPPLGCQNVQLLCQGSTGFSSGGLLQISPNVTGWYNFA